MFNSTICVIFDIIILMTITKTTAKPFLKWVGGKGRLITELEKFYPKDFDRFYEPFVGGGAMFFSINPSDGNINDKNEILICAYKHIRDNVENLISLLSVLHDYYWSLQDLALKKQFYLEKRTLFNSLNNECIEKTVLLIFLNKTCFNGMYRENSKGGFNVPFNNSEKPPICDAINLRNVSNALQRTKITSASYDEAVDSAVAGDFIYFDPPYHPINATSSFTSYNSSGFNENDQILLRDKFKELSDRGCKVMLSNSNAPLITQLYKDFNIHEIYAARSINATGTKRGKIAELLITNY